mgnify:CR=1 FL=1
MENSNELEKILGEWLDFIDQTLAEQGQPLHMRPLFAATQFIKFGIVAVKNGEEEAAPGEFPEYADSKWFKTIYKATEKWYHQRFGKALAAKKSEEYEAVTLVRNTPYLFKVPMTTTQVEIPGETAWICFHESVQHDENVLEWLCHRPNYELLSQESVEAARSLTKEIASNLRAIHIALIGIGNSNPKMLEMSQHILPNLREVALFLVKGDAHNLKLSYWPMQMACELVLKCLAQQRVQTFKETHDLFHLYDQMPESPPPFPRKKLSKLPNWKKMTDFRYGGGQSVSISQTFDAYRATVAIVAASASAFKKNLVLNKAKFLIKLQRWMK